MTPSFYSPLPTSCGGTSLAAERHEDDSSTRWADIPPDLSSRMLCAARLAHEDMNRGISPTDACAAIASDQQPPQPHPDRSAPQRQRALHSQARPSKPAQQQQSQQQRDSKHSEPSLPSAKVKLRSLEQQNRQLQGQLWLQTQERARASSSRSMDGLHKAAAQSSGSLHERPPWPHLSKRKPKRSAQSGIERTHALALEKKLKQQSTAERNESNKAGWNNSFATVCAMQDATHSTDTSSRRNANSASKEEATAHQAASITRKNGSTQSRSQSYDVVRFGQSPGTQKRRPSAKQNAGQGGEAYSINDNDNFAALYEKYSRLVRSLRAKENELASKWLIYDKPIGRSAHEESQAFDGIRSESKSQAQNDHHGKPSSDFEIGRERAELLAECRTSRERARDRLMQRVTNLSEAQDASSAIETAVDRILWNLVHEQASEMCSIVDDSAEGLVSSEFVPAE